MLRLLGLSRRQAIVALRVLASAQPVGDNAGLLRPWLAGATVAEKNGWLSDTRTTAAIVYDGGRATIVVVELYRPGVTYGRRSSSDVASCRPRVCWASAGRLRRDAVERLLQLLVERAGLRGRVADRSQPDPPGDGERADHVQRDAGLPLRVPAERALGDDVEQVVGRQRLVRRRIEVVGRDVVLDVAEPRAELAASGS